MYVALTRAKQDLVLTRSLNRINYGRGFEPCTPSRFLGEIPSELITGLGRRAPTRRTTNARGKQQALNDFLARHGGGGSSPTRVPRATMPRAPIPTRPKKPAAPAEEVVTRAPESLDDFQVGVQVVHVDYGVGTIRRVRGRGPQMQITVDFPSKRGKTILPKYAKLEVVLS
jgi:DNA helicase-2/ATP-dependent DNA helicase PcrA